MSAHATASTQLASSAAKRAPILRDSEPMRTARIHDDVPVGDRLAVVASLRSEDAIAVTGARGAGKSLLLRSLWERPPRGFAPVLVPPADAPAASAATGTCRR